MATDIKSLAQFDDIQAHLSSKTELIVLFCFDPCDEPCKRMVGNLDFWSRDNKYKDRVLFIKCADESATDVFNKYNIKVVPTYLFIKNNEQVAPPATGSGIRRFQIEAIMDGLLNGQK